MKIFKKISSIVIIGLISISIIPHGKASAAWTGEQSLSGIPGCKVQVYTDATNYYKGAGTIGWKASQNGSCGKLYYKAFTGRGSQFETTQYGYFSYATPMKYIDITGVNVIEYNQVNLNFYSDSARTKYVGAAWSNTVIVHPQ